MSWILRFYKSAIGKKTIMAVTGIVLFGFVLGHMAGNLKLFLPAHDGVPALDVYGEFLRDMGTPAVPRMALLWVARVVLLGSVILHILAAVQLTMMNRRARPIPYGRKKAIAATYAARTMRWGGIIILLFVIYHLLHFTIGTVHPDFRPGQPYHNMIVGFQVPWVALFYIIANIALGFHLYHGLWSMFQSLGWNHPKFNSMRRTFATLFALIITLGNLSFPIAVLTGIVR